MPDSAAAIVSALACGRPGCPCATTARRGHGNTHCPAHVDPNPSLNVDTGPDGRVLVYCHGGCPQDDVIRALINRRVWPSRNSRPSYSAVKGATAQPLSSTHHLDTLPLTLSELARAKR